MAQQGFIFGAGTPWTYEQLQRKRQIADQLASGIGTPRNVGEGLSAIGKALAARGINKRADARDAELKAASEAKWGGLLGGAMPGGVLAASTASAASPAAKIGDDTMAALIKTGLTSRGLPDHTADAFVMNFKDESSLNPAINEANPLVPGSRGGFGLAQWTGPRRVALEEFAAGQGKPASDMNVQLDFLMSELQGSEANAGKAIMAAPDTGSAATAIVNEFLRPAEPHRAARAAEYGGAPQFDIGTLTDLMGDPYATPGQKAIVELLLGQQMDAMDPMRAIEMERAQLELDALRNPQQPEILTERTALAEAAGLQAGTPEYQNFMATGELAGGDTPSSFAALDLQAKAAGYQPGTPEYQNFMRTGGGSGVPAAFESLDLQAKAAGFQPGTPEYKEFMATRGAGLIAEAKLRGEDTALLDSQASKMEGLETVVTELDALADKATYTMAGRALDTGIAQLGLEPRDAAVARSEYIAKVDNQVLPMLRDTFGAAFTVQEGETLRATLGDPNKTPAEKKAVLRAFIDQKKRDIAALEKRTGRAATAPDEGLTAEERDYLGLE